MPPAPEAPPDSWGGRDAAVRSALLHLIDTTHAAAGALCLLDEEAGVLRLAIETGISDEGCRILRAIGGSSCTEAWSEPLACLLDRRPTILTDRPDVPLPPLMDLEGPITSVACIPLNESEKALGTLVLVLAPPHDIDLTGIRELAPSVEQLQGSVSRLLRHVAATRSVETVESWASARARLLERSRRLFRRGVSSAVASPWLEPLLHPLYGGAGTRERLRRLETNTRTLWRSLREIEVVRRDQEAADAELRSRLYDAEARLGRQYHRYRALEREHRRTLEDLTQVVRRESETRQAADDVLDKTRADREETVRKAFEATETAAEATAARVVELAEARHRLAAIETETQAARDAARTAHRQLEQIRADKDDALDERRHLACALEESRKREASLIARLTKLEEYVKARREAPDPEVLSQEAVDAAFRERLYEAEARTTHERQKSRTLQRECQRLRTSLEDSKNIAERAHAQLEDQRNRADLAERERSQAIAQTEEVRAELNRLNCARVQGDDEVRQLKTQVEWLQAAEKTATAEQARLQAALDQATQQAAEATEQLERLPRESQQRPDPPSSTPAKAPAQVGSPVGSTPSGPSILPTTDRDALLVVLDEDPEWSNVEVADLDVRCLAPDPGLSSRLATTPPARLVANLAAPGVLTCLVELREAGCQTPVWACLTTRDRSDAVLLGQIEPITAPLGVEAVLSWFGRHVPRSTRALVAGSNINAFISLREALVRAGMSVSVAWDTKQASDLLDLVRPQVAVLDLGLPPRGAHGLIPRLAALTPPPTLLLMAGQNDARGFSEVIREDGDELPWLARDLCLAQIEASGPGHS